MNSNAAVIHRVTTAIRSRAGRRGAVVFCAALAAACASNPKPETPVAAEQLARADACERGVRSNPELASGRRARLAIQSAYPDSLQAQGVGGKVSLWLLVMADGTVGDVSLEKGSGHAGLDAAAMNAAWDIEFRPACREGRAADVWLYQEFVFKPDR